METRGKERIVIVSLCLLFIFVCLATRKHYGITWDASATDWYHAERHLNYLLTFDSSWIDFGVAKDPAPWPDHPRLLVMSQPTRTLHFGNFISAIGCRIFHRGLGVEAVTAHHIPNILMVAGAMAALFFFIRSFAGMTAATVATIAFAAQPHFYASTQFNTKDVPYACLMAFTLLLARRAIIRKDAPILFASAVLLGLSGLTKPNAALIPVILAIWFVVSRKDIAAQSASASAGRGKNYFIPVLLASPIIAMASYFAAWPYLWFNTVERVRLFIAHYIEVASSGPPGIQWDTMLLFLSAQPPALLVFAGIGVAVAVANAWKGRNREAYVLLILWFALPVLRMALPRVRDYDGVRHFIEYAAPLGGLCGVGVGFALDRLAEAFGKTRPYAKKAAVAAIALVFAPWAVAMARLHPHEIVYFNFLIGGFPGAYSRWSDATDYWGYSYIDGIRWLNEHAEQGAVIIAPVGGQIILSYQRNLLRKDLQVVTLELKDPYTAEQAIMAAPPELRSKMYAIYVTKRGWHGIFTKEVDKSWPEVFSIRVDETPLLKIVKAPEQ